MLIRSLGYGTDLIFPRFDAQVLDRGDYLVVRTPSNPSFYWGNFLLFGAPPVAEDFERWPALFAQEVGAPPLMRHIALGWDGTGGEKGEIARFLEAGFALDEAVVLTAREVVRPPKYHETVRVRPLSSDWEWEAALENQVASRDLEHELEREADSYRVYISRQMIRYQAMVRAGLGAWFGAFLNDRLVADAGLFVSEGTGRFQAVATHPDFRRQGICGALIHQMGLFALQNMGAQVLVMRADVHYHAARIYQSAGFAPVELQMGMTAHQNAPR